MYEVKGEGLDIRGQGNRRALVIGWIAAPFLIASIFPLSRPLRLMDSLLLLTRTCVRVCSCVAESRQAAGGARCCGAAALRVPHLQVSWAHYITLFTQCYTINIAGPHCYTINKGLGLVLDANQSHWAHYTINNRRTSRELPECSLVPGLLMLAWLERGHTGGMECGHTVGTGRRLSYSCKRLR
jgi:hypothetical protein